MDAPRLVAVALLTAGDRVLLLRRPRSGPLPDQWEFPGGKVEFGEHPWDALRRELREELSLRVRDGSLFGVYSHVYELGETRAHYVLVAYRTRIEGRVRETEDRRWATAAELRRLPIVPGSKGLAADFLKSWRR